ncbi:MAG: GNAT family N-acetyltransferase [Pseudomonadota bacterium]
MSNAPPHVGRLTPGDAAAFRDIRLEALRTAPDQFGSRLEDWAHRPLADFAALLENTRAFGARGDAGLVGLAGWHTPQGDALRGKLIMVFVRPGWRGRGVVGRLLTRICEDARGRVDRLELTVNTTNAAAMWAYERAGFRAYDTVPGGLRHGDRVFDTARMRRDLPGQTETVSDQVGLEVGFGPASNS